uniref:Uncharacterized protein n=1 Tax=Hymenochirus boettgeri TaxID=247094 RepID=A0A8T2IAR7_9PIPI|nr:hypothetical protein GDO86_018417 [Hymenochirus boettgeri]
MRVAFRFPFCVGFCQSQCHLKYNRNCKNRFPVYNLHSKSTFLICMHSRLLVRVRIALNNSQWERKKKKTWTKLFSAGLFAFSPVFPDDFPKTAHACKWTGNADTSGQMHRKTHVC